jgi:hypothetical protein
MSKTRDETKTLVMRQIAIFNGVNPNMVIIPTTKLSREYSTLAESILATVERKMREHHDGLGVSMDIARWLP